MDTQSVKTGTYFIDDKEINFDFYTSLSSAKKIKFVKSVVNTIVDDDNYNYIIKDLVFDFFVIDIFTDVDTSDVFESSNPEYVVDEMEELVNGTLIAEIVKANADDGVFDELHKAVELDIEYKTGIHSNPIAESLASLLDTVEEKFSSIDMDSMMGMADVFGSMSGDITADKMLEAYAKSDIFKKQWQDVKNNDKPNIIPVSITSPTT